MNKNTILLVIMLFVFVFSIRAFSAPAFYWASPQPSWYNASMPMNDIKEKMIWEYGSANFSSVTYSPSSVVSSVTWATNTTVYLNGGKSLSLAVSLSLSSSTFYLNLTAANPLPSVAVRVDGYYSGSTVYVNGYLAYDYTDGTSQSFSFSSVALSSSAGLVKLLDFQYSAKPVSKIRFSICCYASQIRFYIEYPGYVYRDTSLSTSSFTVPTRNYFNSSLVEWWTRFAKPIVSVSPSTDAFIDELHGTASNTYTAVLASYTYAYTLAQKYTISLLDASASPLGGSVGTGKVTVASDVNATYLKLNTTLLYSASFLNNTTLNPPQTGTAVITFSVQDYGAGYQVLEVADLQGRIVGSGAIGTTGQVAMNLTPYASYVLQVSKPGLSKTVGLVTISSSNIQLAVMPSLPTVKPASWLSASYDYADKELIVNVSCQYPPCFVTVKKIYANGTQAPYTLPACQQPLCSYVVINPDPYFQITANDTSGRQAQASTGLSVPLWNSPLGSVVSTIGQTINLDAWGVNINDFIVFLIGLAIIYAAFTYRNWELGILVFGVWLTVGTLLLGGSGSLMVPGLSLALVGAALSYMLKREQQP